MPKKDFAAMESSRRSGDSAARAALRSRMAHPTSLRLDEVQSNPLNPRYADEDPEVRELAETLTRVGQLQPALVVPREQYLQAYPSQRANLGGEPWVVIVGNRRLAASHVAGRSAIDVRVAADLDTAEDLEDRILIENIQRKDRPPLLEAEHLQRRLSRPGQTTRSVGAAIGKSHAYVQQRVDLLKMIPEFRELFRSGEINLKIGRKLGSLDETEQRSRLAAGPPYSPTDSPAGAREVRAPSGNPVSNPEPVGGAPAAETATSPIIPQQSQPTDDTVPGNRVSNDASAGENSDTSRSSSGEQQEMPPHSDSHPAVTDPRGGAESHPDSQAPYDDLENVRVSVSQWLDSALVELDGALEKAGGDQLSNVLAETQSHILAAREALVRARS